jgi:uncharacterized protein DUF6799
MILRITVFIREFCGIQLLGRKEVRNVDMKEDAVMMKKGTMMVIRNGEMKPMDMVMTLSNGTRIAMDGTITMPDGTSRMMMDGEAMTMDGEMTTMADIKDPDMQGDMDNKTDDR